MDTLREQIIEEMKARRIDHKTYTDADWLMAEYEKHIAEVLCELLEGEKYQQPHVDTPFHTEDKIFAMNATITQMQALIRQTLEPISNQE